MKQDKRLIYYILYWVLYSGLISIYLFRHELLNIIADVILIILILRGHSFRVKNINKYIDNKVLFFILLFLITGTISSVINLVPITSYMWVLHFYIRYWILLVCICNTFNFKDVLKVKKIFYNAAIFNIILCIIQVAMGIKGDLLGGSFAGGNAEIALLIMIITIMGSCDYFRGNLKKSKALLLIIGFMYISIVGEIKFLYFMIPLFIGLSYILIKKFSIKNIIILALSSILFVPSMKYILSFYYDDSYIEFVFNVDEVEEHLHQAHTGGERGINRATSIEIVSTYILQNTHDFLIGKGIGSGSSSSLFSSEIYRNFKDTNYYNFAPSYLLVETGWIGSISYYMVYIMMLTLFYKKYRSTNNEESKYWASCGILATLMTGAFIWYNILPIFTYYIFFFFFSICFVALNEKAPTRTGK